MTGLDVRPLEERLSFGARVRGVTPANITNDLIREQLGKLFEKEGLLLFEEVEPTGSMHAAISAIAGPPKDHAQKTVPRVDQKTLPGVIDILSEPEQLASIKVNGTLLASWRPWHFDHCYNNELNRGGVLRAIEIPPEGGMTGFADGVDLYQSLSPDLRERIEGRNVIYRMNVIMENLRFGRPEYYEVFGESPLAHAVMDEMADKPRGIHPAVWTRKTGEKVLHVSPWMAEGIEGAENEEGDALLDAVCREIFAIAKENSYFHKWKTTDMLLWDNWRMLHAVSGHPPHYSRRMQRTTIKGDYGLGYFEDPARDDATVETAA